MRGYASTREHRAEDLTLLCGTHHDHHTRGWLPDDVITARDNEPFNKTRPQTSPHPLFFSGDKVTISFGTCGYVYSNVEWMPQVPLLVDGIPLIKFRSEANHVLLSLVVLDEKNRQKVKIVDNELVVATDNWDVEVEGTRLVVREGDRKISFDCRFHPPDSIEILTASLWCNGINVRANADGLYLPDGIRLLRCTFHDCNVAFAVKPPMTGGAGIALAVDVADPPPSDITRLKPTGKLLDSPNSPALHIMNAVGLTLDGFSCGYVALCDKVHGCYDPDLPD
jgi:hypothetical protein